MFYNEVQIGSLASSNKQLHQIEIAYYYQGSPSISAYFDAISYDWIEGYDVGNNIRQEKMDKGNFIAPINFHEDEIGSTTPAGLTEAVAG